MILPSVWSIGKRTKQVVELLHYTAVVVPDQVGVAHRCPRADVPKTLLSYFQRSVQAVLGGGVPMSEGMESALQPQLLQQRLELPLYQVFGMSRMPSVERNSGSSGWRPITNELRRSASRGEMLNILGCDSSVCDVPAVTASLDDDHAIGQVDVADVQPADLSAPDSGLRDQPIHLS